MPKETYLGDGLYASFDGWQIMLRAPQPWGDHCVYLDPFVFRALQEFGQQVFSPPAPDKPLPANLDGSNSNTKRGD